MNSELKKIAIKLYAVIMIPLAMYYSGQIEVILNANPPTTAVLTVVGIITGSYFFFTHFFIRVIGLHKN